MHRRCFLRTALLGTGTIALSPSGSAADVTGDARSFLLSDHGCGRATGYAEANKIVTLGDRTHVAWLDSVAEGFRVRVRTLDSASGRWSETVTLGEAHDNHGGPALAVDSRGFLHAVYFPHHHPFRYRKSKRSNDASEWEDEIQFGERLTYPTLVCGPDDTLYLTCRRSFPSEPWQMELWTKPPGGDWELATVIARARFKGYAHFQESLAWSPDRRVLHLCCRIHEKTDKEAYGRIQTVGYMASKDCGRSWRRSDGTAIELPATADSIERLAAGGVDFGRELRVGGMAVDAEGRPQLVYSVTETGVTETLLASPDGGRWRRRSLSRELPEPWRGWSLLVPGGVTFNRQGKMFVAAMIQHVGKGEQGWGHPTSEVVLLTSADRGRTFSFQMVSRPDPSTSNWLPNIERATGHNVVPDRPGILYTAGPPGEKNTDILSSRVWWFRGG